MTPAAKATRSPVFRSITQVADGASRGQRPLALFLSKGMDEFRVSHVKRAQNGYADELANRALDE